jgi:xanthine dehydrogenase small subunit
MKSNTIQFLHHNRTVLIDFDKVNYRPSTTVLNYLRMQPEFMGTKEGCAEGDCGACTVVIASLNKAGGLTYQAIDSCLLFLPSLHGKQLITVENLESKEGTHTMLHPVQQAMVNHHGSQCGYCTPGFVMALFAMYKSNEVADRQYICDMLAGNLCRCTGYESILQAAYDCCEKRQPDIFSSQEKQTINDLKEIHANARSLALQMPLQKYFVPLSLEEAYAIRAFNKNAIVINGATDTAIRQNKTWEFLPEIIDVSGLEEIKQIEQRDNMTYFGSGVTLEQFRIWARAHLPELLPMLDVFASIQIRNVATIGGNLSTASPIGDLIPLMIALKAKVKIAGLNGQRWVEIEDYITGYRSNCLQTDELLIGIGIHQRPEEVQICTAKISTRRDLDISTLNIAMRLHKDKANQVKEIILAFGGMAEKVKRAKSAESFLTGRLWSRENIEHAMTLVESDFIPISDARSGKAYRMEAAKNLLMKMYIQIENTNQAVSQ